jgi:hypothetical protein
LKCAAPGCFTDIPAGKPTCPQWHQHKDSKHRFHDNVAPWEKKDKKKSFQKDKGHSGGDKRDRNGKFKRRNGKQSSSSSSFGGGAGDKVVGDDDETPAASSSRKSALSASNKRVRIERKEDESS